jgi:hypothetical protein
MEQSWKQESSLSSYHPHLKSQTEANAIMSAGSVYEAVAQALRIFRDNEWVEDIGRGQTPISVKVKHPEIEHTVCVQDFERWLETTPRSPAEMLLKNRLREILAKGR